MPSGKCSVHYIFCEMFSPRRCVHSCSAAEVSISRPRDLTWCHHSFSVWEKKVFFTNAIDIDAVIIVINIMVLMVLSVLLTEIKDEKIFLKLKEMMNRWDK